ncbi:MAG: hypothetical protein ACHREM_03740 [Polyangiales bacterium]
MRVRPMWSWLSASFTMAALNGCLSGDATGVPTHPTSDSGTVGHSDSGATGTVDGGSTEDTSAATPGDDASTLPSTDSGAHLPGDDASTATPDAGPGVTDSATTAPESGTPGTATCGCHGAANCAVWENVYVTFYGFNDNSCTVESAHSCDDIAFPGLGPKKHAVATEATGTYDDPITAAASDQGNETAGGATLQPGTIIYNPLVQKYFIMEDSCLECGDEWKCHLSADDTDDPNPPSGCKAGTYLHIDFWMGPDFASDSTNLNNCEGNSTLGNPYAGVGTVVINPPPDLPVKSPLLYSGSGSTGGCWTSKQADPVSCP